MGTFKITCMECGTEAIVDSLWLDGTSVSDVKLYTLIGGCTFIACKCGNELKNFTEDEE